jgi:hypothetical protein
MKKATLRVLLVVMVLALLVPALASASSSGPAADVAVPAGKSDAPATGGYNIPLEPVVPGAVLYDNGPLTTHPGGGFGGANASALQTALGNSTYGFGHAISSGFRVADNFTVPAGGWNISTITFYAYQTGSTTTSTINNVNLRIWDGQPGASNIVFGDTTTNRLASSTYSGIYRVLDTNLLASDRPIMADVVTVNTTLPAGTYWLDWQTGGTLGSGPWAPPVTILGQTAKPGSDGQQFNPTTGAWAPAVDTGAAATQDFPFLIEGAGATGPSISLSKTVGTTAGVCANTSNITVPQGTTVYYCYTVTNTGDVAFGLHTLTDDVLGTIFTGLAYNLAPGASVNTVAAGLSIPYVANANTTNVGTWLAYNATGGQAQATATATVNVIPPRCPTGSHEVTLVTEAFEGSFPPAGWVVANNTTGCVAPGVPDWTNTDPGANGNLTGGTGLFAIADSDECGSGVAMDAQMWAPTLNLTNYTLPEVSFKYDYNDFSSADSGMLDFSTDGGTTWANIFTWSADDRGPKTYESTFGADGQANTIVRWHYVAGWDWWWEVDDVAITACEPDTPTAVDLSAVDASPVAPVTSIPWAVIPAALAAAAGAVWVARKRR